MVVGDIACDHRSDQAYFGRAPGKVYVGLFRARNKKPQILEFGVSGRYQNAICQAPGALAVESLEYELQEAEGFQRATVCKGLVLSDDACDPIHLFWNHASQLLNWWRNQFRPSNPQLRPNDFI